MAMFNIRGAQKTPADIGVDTSAYEDAVKDYEKHVSVFNSVVQGVKLVSGLVQEDKAKKSKEDNLAFQEWEATNLPQFEDELQEAATKAGEEGQKFSQGKVLTGNPFGKGGLRREHVYPIKEEVVSGLVDKQLNELNLQTDEAKKVKESTRRVMMAQALDQFDAYYDAGLAKQVIRPLGTEQSLDAYTKGAQQRLKDAPFTSEDARSIVKSEIDKTIVEFSKNVNLADMASGGPDEIESIKNRVGAMNLDGLSIAQIESNMRSSFNRSLSQLDDQSLFEMSEDPNRTSQFIRNLQYASDPVQAEVLGEVARDYKTLQKTPLDTVEQQVAARGAVSNTSSVTPFIAMKNRALLDRETDPKALKNKLIVSQITYPQGNKKHHVLGATANDILPDGFVAAVPSSGSSGGGGGGGAGGGSNSATLASAEFIGGTKKGQRINLVAPENANALAFMELLAGTINVGGDVRLTAADINRNVANVAFIEQFLRDSTVAQSGVELDEKTAPVFLREMQDNGLIYDPESESFAFDPRGLSALSRDKLIERYNANLGPGVPRAREFKVIYPNRAGADAPYYFTGVDENGATLPISYDSNSKAYHDLLGGMTTEPVYRGSPEFRDYKIDDAFDDLMPEDRGVENAEVESEINTALNEMDPAIVEEMMSQLNEAGLVDPDIETPTTVAGIAATLAGLGVTTRAGLTRLSGWHGTTEESIERFVGHRISIPPSLTQLENMDEDGWKNLVERPKMLDQPTRTAVRKMLLDTGATEEMIEEALKEGVRKGESHFLKLTTTQGYQDFSKVADVPYTKRHLIDTMKDRALVDLLKTVPDSRMKSFLLEQGIKNFSGRPVAGAPLRAYQVMKKVGEKIAGPEDAGTFRKIAGKVLLSPKTIIQTIVDPRNLLMIAAEMGLEYKIETSLQETGSIKEGLAYRNRQRAKQGLEPLTAIEYTGQSLAEYQGIPHTIMQNLERMGESWKYVDEARKSGEGELVGRARQGLELMQGARRIAGEILTWGNWEHIEGSILSLSDPSLWATSGGYPRKRQWRDTPALPTAEEYDMFKRLDYFAETWGSKAPLLALESHSKDAIVLPANVVDSLAKLTGEPMGGWDSVWQDLSFDAMEASEDWPVEVQQQFAQFVTKNGRVDLHGHMQLPVNQKIVNKYQYQAAVDYLVDVANGSSRVSYGVNDVSRGQALKALEGLSDASGTNIQNLHNILREESLSSSTQDATPMTDGLDLNSDELAPYVESWERFEETMFAEGLTFATEPGTRNMPDAKKHYLQWVSKGMPTRIGGVTRYPHKDYGKALGVHGGNDYLNISAVSYDPKSNRIALDSQLNPQTPYFLAYLDEMDVAPSSPLEMKMAYQDFLQVQDTFTRFQSMQMASPFPEMEELKEFYDRVLTRGSGKVTDTLRDMGDRMVKARYTDPDLYKPVPDEQANRGLLNHIGDTLVEAMPEDFVAKTLDRKGSVASQFASAVAAGDLKKARKALEAKLQESKKVLYADMDRATAQGRSALTDDNRMNAEGIQMIQRAINRIDAELNEQFEPFLGTSTHDSRVSIRWRPYAN